MPRNYELNGHSSIAYRLYQLFYRNDVNHKLNRDLQQDD